MTEKTKQITGTQRLRLIAAADVRYSDRGTPFISCNWRIVNGAFDGELIHENLVISRERLAAQKLMSLASALRVGVQAFIDNAPLFTGGEVLADVAYNRHCNDTVIRIFSSCPEQIVAQDTGDDQLLEEAESAWPGLFGTLVDGFLDTEVIERPLDSGTWDTATHDEAVRMATVAMIAFRDYTKED